MPNQLKDSGLGRGLSSLIPNKKPHAPVRNAVTEWDEPDAERIAQGQEIVELSPREIVPNRYQPRSDWREDQAFEDLIASIRKHGILQPLVVTRNRQGKYEVVAGERRLRAAMKLSLSRVPVIIRSVGELEKLELSLIENIQRKDLNPMERAIAYRKLIDEFSLSHEEAAKRLGKSRTVVTNTLRFLQLPSEIQKALGEEGISEGQAKTILELTTDAERLELFKKIVEEGLTIADARMYVTRRGPGKIIRRVSKTASSDVVAVERELEERFGTKVRIRRRGKGGVVEIEYYSEEELMEVVKKLLR